MGPKEAWLLKAPLDVNKVANVAVIEKTNNQKENTESSKTVSADLYKGSTRNPSDVIFAKEWNTHGGKNCFARAIQVLRTTTGKYVSKTF